MLSSECQSQYLLETYEDSSALSIFHNKFLLGLSEKFQNLMPYARGLEKILWTKELDTQYQAAKNALINATTLAFAKQWAPTCIITDASGYGMSGVLEQYQEGAWKPLALFSRKFTDAELESTFTRELNGASQSVRCFYHMVEGHRCSLVVDHAPLRRAFSRQNDA